MKTEYNVQYGVGCKTHKAKKNVAFIQKRPIHVMFERYGHTKHANEKKVPGVIPNSSGQSPLQPYPSMSHPLWPATRISKKDEANRAPPPPDLVPTFQPGNGAKSGGGSINPSQ